MVVVLHRRVWSDVEFLTRKSFFEIEFLNIHWILWSDKMARLTFQVWRALQWAPDLPFSTRNAQRPQYAHHMIHFLKNKRQEHTFKMFDVALQTSDVLEVLSRSAEERCFRTSKCSPVVLERCFQKVSSKKLPKKQFPPNTIEHCQKSNCQAHFDLHRTRFVNKLDLFSNQNFGSIGPASNAEINQANASYWKHQSFHFQLIQVVCLVYLVWASNYEVAKMLASILMLN